MDEKIDESTRALNLSVMINTAMLQGLLMELHASRILGPGHVERVFGRARTRLEAARGDERVRELADLALAMLERLRGDLRLH